MSSKKESPIVTTQRDPEAAYRDTSDDEQRDPPPPLSFPVSGHYYPVDTPQRSKHGIDTHISVRAVILSLRTLTIPFILAAAILTPQTEPWVGIYGVIIWTFLLTWTTVRLLRSWLLSGTSLSRGAASRWDCCGLVVTCARSPHGGRAGQGPGPWLVRACDLFWIALCVPATVLATAAGVWDRQEDEWGYNGQVRVEERALLACGSIVIGFQIICIALSFIPGERKSRLTLEAVREGTVALPT